MKLKTAATDDVTTSLFTVPAYLQASRTALVPLTAGTTVFYSVGLDPAAGTGDAVWTTYLAPEIAAVIDSGFKRSASTS